MINDEYIENFLSRYDYDVRKSGNARWIDQKCTPDVVNVIADCIVNYSYKKGRNVKFRIKDIWRYPYSEEIIEIYFNKPKPSSKAAENEFDKFFSQPIKLLAYSQILNETKKGRGYIYSINDFDLLEYISFNDKNAFKFLYYYITEVLTDCDLIYDFNQFFGIQTKNSYEELKDSFFLFNKGNTKINGKTESNRIFTKVINPLAYHNKKYGTNKGRLSKDIITYTDLLYNQKNFRDIYSNKPKGITRKEWRRRQDGEIPSIQIDLHKSIRAMQFLRKYNTEYRNGCTEVCKGKYIAKGTQMHHIFPRSDFPEISFLKENIVALSPNQHFLCAHPDNDTHKINESYRKVILEEKLERIHENITDQRIETIYSYNTYVEVLNEGFNKNYETEFNDYLTAKSILRECYAEI